MITSKNKSLIDFAVKTSSSLLQIKTPPKAEIGSPANASLYASGKLSLEANPHALLCFRIAKVGLEFLNSVIKCIAESMSRRLL